MTRNGKADLCGIGSKTNFTGGEIRAFSVSDDTASPCRTQCKKCRFLVRLLALETLRADLLSFDLRQLKRRIKAVIQ